VLFIKRGNVVVNFDLMTDAEYAPSKQQTPAKLTLNFAAPQPASVGASDWSVEARQVQFTGKEADSVWKAIGILSNPDSKQLRG
jgi:hypothetical protein